MGEEQTTNLTFEQAREGVDLSTNTKHRIIIPAKKEMKFLEIEDVLFHWDSAVMMPSRPIGVTSVEGEEDDHVDNEDVAIDQAQSQVTGLDVIAEAFRYLRDNANTRLAIAGHTDTSGNVNYNYGLARKRSQGVLDLLQGNRDSWRQNANQQHQVEDYQQILNYFSYRFCWRCNAPINNTHDDATDQAVENFQDAYNKQYASPRGLAEISVDGDVGPQTWGAFFDLYMEEIARLLCTDVDGLDEWRNHLRFIDDSKQLLPCGESFPIDDAERDEYRSQLNRRVELLLVDDNNIRPLNCPASSGNATHTRDQCPIYDRDKYNRNHLTVNGVRVLRMYADADHTGDVEQTQREMDNLATCPGPIILNNCDCTVPPPHGNLPNPDNSDHTINGVNDLPDFARLIIPSISNLAPNQSVLLQMTNDDALKVHIFDAYNESANELMGDTNGGVVTQQDLTDIRTRDYECAIEATDAARETGEDTVTLSLLLREGNQTIECLHVRFRLAPFILLSNVCNAQRVFVTRVRYNDRAATRARWNADRALDGDPPLTQTQVDDYCDDQEHLSDDFITALTAATGGVTVEAIESEDVWMQDQMEVGFNEAPQSSIHVALDSPRDRSSDIGPQCLANVLRPAILRNDIGYIKINGNATSLDSFGNLEVTAPFDTDDSSHPLGRIVVGGKEGSDQILPVLRNFLKAQVVQTPILEIDTTWLSVAHADEIISFVPAPNDGPDAFRVLMINPRLAVQQLRDLRRAGHGNVRIFAGKSSEQTINQCYNANRRESMAIYNQKIRPIRQQLIDELDLTYDRNDPATSDIIDIPVLFHCRLNSAGRVQQRTGEAVVPDMVNLLVINQARVVVPDPFGPIINGTDVIKQEVETRLQNIGLDPVFVDDFELYHRAAGEIHCGTNAQRQIPTNIHWWETFA